jgi:hemolysin activation/secretion protein
VIRVGSRFPAILVWAIAGWSTISATWAQTIPTPPDPGRISNVPKLENQVAWYNKGRLAQIQASLQPGVSFGLTNIDLSVLEPPTNLLQLFVDNQGVYSVAWSKAA